MTQKTLKLKNRLRTKRKLRTRGKIVGDAARPRLSIFRSNKYFYAQAINDAVGNTLAAVDGRKLGVGNNKEQVKTIAAEMAKNLKAKGINEVLFDRNGYLYHGVVASFADALRENGIKL